MSDELKIELQVETDIDKAKSQLDNLIDEYKKKKPIELEFKLGNTNLDQFQSNIKSITSSLDSLSKIDFSNLKTIETNLKNISKVASEYQKTLASTNNKNSSSSGSNSVLDVLPGFDKETIQRLSKNQKEALNEIEKLKVSASEVESAYEEYRNVIRNSNKKLREDNKQYFSEVNDYETMFDTKHYEKLVGYYKQLRSVMSEYNSLGVNLTQVDQITNEKYDGTMAYLRYQEYMDGMGLSNKKFEELVVRAKDLTAKKNNLLKNIKNNLKKASDDEKIALEYLNDLYKKAPEADLGEANALKKYITDIIKSHFEFDFDDLDLRFEEDFERLYKRYFLLLDNIKDEYNQKFKDVDGLEGFNIFDTDSLKEETEKLDKEILNTANSIVELKDLSKDILKTLGLDNNSINVFKDLTNSVENLENKLTSLQGKFSNAFEISSDSFKALVNIKEALTQINKLTDEQKQTFFDFGLDVENIKKAKDETKELKEATDNISNVSFDGLIESYSVLQSATGQILSETEKLRTSAMSTVTLNYKYEEDELTGENVKTLSTAKYSEEISKRSKELLKEYKNASNDLIKAQKEYYKALTDGKSSEDTIDSLTQNVKEMETKLSGIRGLVSELQGYPDVMDDVFDKFNELDKLRHSQ
ncbi:MAG: hypothetical protein J6D12_04965, partial [Peptostreptococcaceae bacterium]|nr:hypothetical protein [Peptostreptococcaceae bacterium]